MMSHVWRLLIFLPFLFFAVACEDEVEEEIEEDIEEEMQDDENEEEIPTLIEAANSAGLSSLVTAIGEVEGLDATLLAEEEITIFAPNNEAFDNAIAAYEVANLGELIEAIGGVENLELLLGLHVVPSTAFAADLSEGDQTFTTLSGQDITVNKSGEQVTVTDTQGNTATVVTADVEIENGVVHVIDGVLLPDFPPTQNVVQITVGNSGASAYFVSEIVGNESVTALNQDNSTWTLAVGTRYEITVTNSGSHPFALRNAADEILLSMNNVTGSFENDADVDFVSSGDTFNFTMTQALADEVDNYVCTFHASMTGSIVVN